MKLLIRCVSVVTLFMCCGNSVAQVVRPGYFIDGHYPMFNADSIRKHNIEEITIRIMRKPSSRPIYDDGKRAIYRFNKGLLTAFIKVFPGKRGLPDTTSRFFEYANGLLTATEIKQGRYRKRTEILRKNDSTCIETTLVKRGEEDWSKLNREEIKTSRRRTSSTQFEIVHRGGIDAKPYERTMTQTDLEGHFMSREKWAGPRLISNEEWNYENDLVASYVYNNNQDNQRFKITYSTANRLQDEGTWCIDNDCRSWSIVYYDNGLPKGWIIMDKVRQDMEIWEFRYRP